MFEDNIEKETLETPEVETEEKDDNGEGEDASAELEKLRKENADLQEKNRKLYARAKSGTTNKSEGLAVDAVLQLQAEGFGPADILEFKKEAQDMGVSIDSLVKNKRFIAGFKAEKTAKEAESKSVETTPSSSGRNFFASKDNKPFKDMSKQEREAAFQEKMKASRVNR
jgi:hypothetical protein